MISLSLFKVIYIKYKNMEDDLELLKKICKDIASGNWDAHWEENSYILRPSGNPLTKHENQEMVKNKDLVIHTQELVSINKIDVYSEIALACITVHQVFSYKNIPNDDISVILIVFKKIDNTWKMISGSRSQGRNPNKDSLPVFPKTSSIS